MAAASRGGRSAARSNDDRGPTFSGVYVPLLRAAAGVPGNTNPPRLRSGAYVKADQTIVASIRNLDPTFANTTDGKAAWQWLRQQYIAAYASPELSQEREEMRAILLKKNYLESNRKMRNQRGQEFFLLGWQKGLGNLPQQKYKVLQTLGTIVDAYATLIHRHVKSVDVEDERRDKPRTTREVRQDDRESAAQLRAQGNQLIGRQVETLIAQANSKPSLFWGGKVVQVYADEADVYYKEDRSTLSHSFDELALSILPGANDPALTVKGTSCQPVYAPNAIQILLESKKMLFLVPEGLSEPPIGFEGFACRETEDELRSAPQRTLMGRRVERLVAAGQTRVFLRGQVASTSQSGVSVAFDAGGNSVRMSFRELAGSIVPDRLAGCKKKMTRGTELPTWLPNCWQLLPNTLPTIMWNGPIQTGDEPSSSQSADAGAGAGAGADDFDPSDSLAGRRFERLLNNRFWRGTVEKDDGEPTVTLSYDTLTRAETVVERRTVKLWIVEPDFDLPRQTRQEGSELPLFYKNIDQLLDLADPAKTQRGRLTVEQVVNLGETLRGRFLEVIQDDNTFLTATIVNTLEPGDRLRTPYAEVEYTIFRERMKTVTMDQLINGLVPQGFRGFQFRNQAYTKPQFFLNLMQLRTKLEVATNRARREESYDYDFGGDDLSQEEEEDDDAPTSRTHRRFRVGKKKIKKRLRFSPAAGGRKRANGSGSTGRGNASGSTGGGAGGSGSGGGGRGNGGGGQGGAGGGRGGAGGEQGGVGGGHGGAGGGRGGAGGEQGGGGDPGGGDSSSDAGSETDLDSNVPTEAGEAALARLFNTKRERRKLTGKFWRELETRAYRVECKDGEGWSSKVTFESALSWVQRFSSADEEYNDEDGRDAAEAFGNGAGYQMEEAHPVYGEEAEDDDQGDDRQIVVWAKRRFVADWSVGGDDDDEPRDAFAWDVAARYIPFSCRRPTPVHLRRAHAQRMCWFLRQRVRFNWDYPNERKRGVTVSVKNTRNIWFYGTVQHVYFDGRQFVLEVYCSYDRIMRTQGNATTFYFDLESEDIPRLGGNRTNARETETWHFPESMWQNIEVVNEAPPRGFKANLKGDAWSLFDSILRPLETWTDPNSGRSAAIQIEAWARMWSPPHFYVRVHVRAKRAADGRLRCLAGASRDITVHYGHLKRALPRDAWPHKRLNHDEAAARRLTLLTQGQFWANMSWMTLPYYNLLVVAELQNKRYNTDTPWASALVYRDFCVERFPRLLQMAPELTPAEALMFRHAGLVMSLMRQRRGLGWRRERSQAFAQRLGDEEEDGEDGEPDYRYEVPPGDRLEEGDPASGNRPTVARVIASTRSTLWASRSAVPLELRRQMVGVRGRQAFRADDEDQVRDTLESARPGLAITDLISFGEADKCSVKIVGKYDLLKRNFTRAVWYGRNYRLCHRVVPSRPGGQPQPPPPGDDDDDDDISDDESVVDERRGEITPIYLPPLGRIGDDLDFVFRSGTVDQYQLKTMFMHTGIRAHVRAWIVSVTAQQGEANRFSRDGFETSYAELFGRLVVPAFEFMPGGDGEDVPEQRGLMSPYVRDGAHESLAAHVRKPAAKHMLGGGVERRFTAFVQTRIAADSSHTNALLQLLGLSNKGYRCKKLTFEYPASVPYALYEKRSEARSDVGKNSDAGPTSRCVPLQIFADSVFLVRKSGQDKCRVVLVELKTLMEFNDRGITGSLEENKTIRQLATNAWAFEQHTGIPVWRCAALYMSRRQHAAPKPNGNDPEDTGTSFAAAYAFSPRMPELTRLRNHLFCAPTTRWFQPSDEPAATPQQAALFGPVTTRTQTARAAGQTPQTGNAQRTPGTAQRTPGQGPEPQAQQSSDRTPSAGQTSARQPRVRRGRGGRTPAPAPPPPANRGAVFWDENYILFVARDSGMTEYALRECFPRFRLWASAEDADEPLVRWTAEPVAGHPLGPDIVDGAPYHRLLFKGYRPYRVDEFYRDKLVVFLRKGAPYSPPPHGDSDAPTTDPEPAGEYDEGEEEPEPRGADETADEDEARAAGEPPAGVFFGNPETLRRRAENSDEGDVHKERRKELNDRVKDAAAEIHDAIVAAVAGVGMTEAERMETAQALFVFLKKFFFEHGVVDAPASWDVDTFRVNGRQSRFAPLRLQDENGDEWKSKRMGASRINKPRDYAAATLSDALREDAWRSIAARTIHRAVNDRIMRTFMFDGSPGAKDDDVQPGVTVSRKQAGHRFLHVSQRSFWRRTALLHALNHVDEDIAQVKAKVAQFFDEEVGYPIVFP